MMRVTPAFITALVALAFVPLPSLAEEADSTAVAEAPGIIATDEPQPELVQSSDDEGPGLSYLVPELEHASFRVSPGPRKFRGRFSFNPGFGQLGSQDLFAFRLAYNPNSWLGYEVSLGHNPANSLHALLHTFNVILRYPLPWRLQPYGTVGYGMLTVYPGQAINADPVTKNAITAGGGLEFYIRDDIAIRGEIRSATVYGQELGRDDTVTYQYREFTFGLAFYRSLGG